MRGIAWAAAGSVFQAALGLVSLAILARLLGPSAFGLSAVALTAIALPDLVVSSVLPDALRQRKDIENRHIDATFWIGIGLATVSALLIGVGSGQIGRWLGAPDAAPVIMAATLALPIGAAGSVPVALLSRNLDFSKSTMVGAYSNVTAALVGPALALCGAGVWSVIAMEVARRVAMLAAALVYSGWRPGRAGGFGAFTELLRFNSATLAIYALSFADAFVPRVLIARLLGVEALGIYSMARRILESITGAVIGPFTSVVLSASARLADEKPALAGFVSGLYRASGVVAYPAFLGMIAIAPLAVPMAFGERWGGAVLALQMLLLVGLRTSTGAFNAGILRGVGHSHLMLRLLLLGVVLQCALIPFGAVYGIVGVCAAVVVRTWATWPIGAVYLRRATGLSLSEQAAAGAAAIGPSVAMAIVTLVLSGWLPVSWAPQLRLLCLIACAVVLYPILLAVLCPNSFRQSFTMLVSLLRGEPPELARRLQGEPRPDVDPIGTGPIPVNVTVNGAPIPPRAPGE